LPTCESTEVISYSSGDGESCQCLETGSGSGSGSGSGDECRFEAMIRVSPTMDDCAQCTYDILIWAEPEDGDPCTDFEDVDIDEVVAEACGLPDLPAGTRVIMAKIPGGLPGREALGSGEEPVEWFVVRACTADDCANPCDPEPDPFGPPCCGKYCSEHPNLLTVTVEMLSGDLSGAGAPYSFTISKHNGSPEDCNDAADTMWNLLAPIADGTIWPGVTTDPDPGPYPTWLDIESFVLFCGDNDLATGACAGSGTGSGSGDIGPEFAAYMSGGIIGGGDLTSSTGNTLLTQDLTVSCCEPLYLEYTVTGQFGMVGGAGTVPAIVTLKVTITE